MTLQRYLNIWSVLLEKVAIIEILYILLFFALESNGLDGQRPMPKFEQLDTSFLQ